MEAANHGELDIAVDINEVALAGVGVVGGIGCAPENVEGGSHFGIVVAGNVDVDFVVWTDNCLKTVFKFDLAAVVHILQVIYFARSNAGGRQKGKKEYKEAYFGDTFHGFQIAVFSVCICDINVLNKSFLSLHNNKKKQKYKLFLICILFF